MAHKVRCSNQNNAIEEIHQKMKQDCINSNGKDVVALMIGDYKMKFEPMSQRETTLDHYGNRGISWHWFCLQFYLLQSEKTNDGHEINVPMKYTVYLDQIVSDGNKQDSLSVYSLLDTALGQISNELTFISQIILQTYNAKSITIHFYYVQSHCLISCMHQKVYVSRNLYTPRPRMVKLSRMPILQE